MRSSRAGFTLFELILSIALFAVLLTLIGMAVNLYLMRVDADRSRVEEAQLARSVLTMIADDIHAASIYKPQDTKDLAALMLASKPFDVDTVDAAAGSPKPGGPSGPTAATKIAAIASTSSTSGQSATGSTGSSTSSGSTTSASGSGTDQTGTTMPLGLNGSDSDIYIDVTRIPRQEELFSTVTGYTNAPSPVSSGSGGMTSSTSTTDGNVNPPADLKTVHYYVRPGNSVEPGSEATTSLAPGTQAGVGGLVREEVPRQLVLFSEQNGNGSAVGTGGTLIAPEVVQIQFQYFDGSQLATTWDMNQTPQLPVAIEVAIWLKSQKMRTTEEDIGATQALSGTHEYKQVVFLPMAALSAGSTAQSTDSSSSSSSSSSSATDSSSSGTDSVFNSNE
ncbi:MAG TPA: prepilin-type N-terminal cleavage/methylation domain-containing protein [Lacipirellulaceae bacterium]|jgi:prepilin-type N-terminal cleavage/methylation domain-containing protein|nr:prepilin-type N-terminal cleavage/methylation domain-containing protein [Lacipirellulaceae bacterium]